MSVKREMWSPEAQHSAPSTGAIRYWLARGWLTLLGWNVTGKIPPYRKFVLVGGPHTSNWDFFIGLPALMVLRLKVYWMAKHSLFFWPLGPIMRVLGGIAIDRTASHGVVFEVAESFKSRNELIIGVPAKGTRGKREYWRSGFYHIAREAGVPVVCAYIDYKTKIVHIGYSFEPSGDIGKDMDGVRKFFEGVQGKNPELDDRIRLKEEDA